MTAVVMIPPAPLSMQLALALFAVMGIGLALHENGWLAYLRSRLVIGALVAVLMAGAVQQVIYHCESWWCWIL